MQLMYDHFIDALFHGLAKHLKSAVLNPEGERLIVGRYPDVILDGLIERILDVTNTERRLKSGQRLKTWILEARQGTSIEVLPYRTWSDHRHGQKPRHWVGNGGSAHFVAHLRDHYVSILTQGISVPVLLAIDNNPIETLESASVSLTAAGIAAPLGPRTILETAIEHQHGPTVADKIIDQFIPGWRDGWEEIREHDLEQVLKAARQCTSTAFYSDFGKRLHEIGQLLPDPELDESNFNRERFSSNRNLVRIIDDAHAPQKDFDEAVSEHFKQEAAQNILNATAGLKTDLGKLTYQRLRDGQRKKLSARVTLGIDAKNTPFKSMYQRGNNFAIPVPPSQDLMLYINSPGLDHNFKVTTTVFNDAAKADASITGAGTVCFTVDGSYLREGSPLLAGVTVRPLRGRRQLSEIYLLLIPSESGYAAFEREMDIDLTEGALRIPSGRDGSIYVLGPDGKVKAKPSDSLTTYSPDLGKIDAPVNLTFPPPETDEIEVKVLNLSMPGDRPQELRVYTAPVEDGDNTEEPAGGVAWTLLRALQKASAGSKTKQPHEKLEIVAALQGEVTCTPGGEINLPGYGFIPLDEDIEPWFGFEKRALETGDTTVWEVVKTAGEYELDQASEFREAQMWGTPPSGFDGLMDARRRFVEALQHTVRQDQTEYLSVMLVDFRHKKPIREAAYEYINIYASLVGQVTDSGETYKDSFNWLLFLDSVFALGESGEVTEILLLPFHPLNLSHLLGLFHTVDEWLIGASADPRTMRFGEGEPDPAMLAPSGLIPALQYKQSWFSTTDAPVPTLTHWPRFLRDDLRVKMPDAYQRKIITEKINQFLDTYPMLMNPPARVPLKINIVNPGTGRQIVGALFDFYKGPEGGDKADPRNHETRRGIHLTLISDDASSGSELAMLFSGEVPSYIPSSPQAREVLDHIRRNVTYSRLGSNEDPPYAHITFRSNIFEAGYTGQTSRIDTFPDALLHRGLMPKPTRYLARRSDGDSKYTYMTHTWLAPYSVDDDSPTWSANLRNIARGMQIMASYQEGGLITPDYAAIRTVNIFDQGLAARELHDSLWAVHLDREIGLEIFQGRLEDNGQTSPFIIDYSDQHDTGVQGFDAITTTAHLAPYIEAVRSILDAETDDIAKAMIEVLNLLSGRWALRLIDAADTTVREKLANTLVFQYLRHVEKVIGTSDDGRTISLALSLEDFLRRTPAVGLPLQGGMVAKMRGKGPGSDDLLLVTLHKPEGHEPIKISGRIIEVKYGTSDHKKGARQVTQTFDWLAEWLGEPHRTDRLLRSADLARYIQSYVDRYLSFGLITSDDLDSLDYYTGIYPAIINGDFRITFKYKDPVSGIDLIGDVIQLPEDGEYYHSRVLPGTQVRHITIPGSWRAALQDDERAPALSEAKQYGPDRPWVLSTPNAPGPAKEHPQGTAKGGINPPAPPYDGGRPEEIPDQIQRADRAAEGPIGYDEAPETPLRPTDPPAIDHSGSSLAAVSAELALHDPPIKGHKLDARGLDALALNLSRTLHAYNIRSLPVKSENIETSAGVIRFKVILETGETLSKLKRHAEDLQRELEAIGPLSINNLPGTAFVSIDMPRPDRGIVPLSRLLNSEHLQGASHDDLIIPLGEGLGGNLGYCNLASLPHLLVAGSTGSGKTVFLYNAIIALAAVHDPEILRIALIDPKTVDFGLFRSLPHLWEGRILTDPVEAVDFLQDRVLAEIARRQEILHDAGEVNMADYNRSSEKEDRLPRMVIIIDEFADLMAVLDSAPRKEFESRVQRIAQIGRALGVHLVLATQRPSTDVITGTIRANIPGRISFRLPSGTDSGTILNQSGAETLMGKGDLLFSEEGHLSRYQGPYVSTRAVRAAVDIIKSLYDGA